jgi:hypothetical protein
MNEVRSLGLQMLAIVTTLGFFRCPFSFIYVVASYGCCCCCCCCYIRVEKEEVVATQEHKKPSSKRNPRNSKPGRRKTRKNLRLSTLSDREQFF